MNKKRPLTRFCAEPGCRILIARDAQSAYCNDHRRHALPANRKVKDPFSELQRYMKERGWEM